MKILNLSILDSIGLNLALATIFIIFLILLYFALRKINQDNNSKNLNEIYLKIKQDIESAVTPKFIELSPNTNDLVELAIDVWRIKQRIIKALANLPEDQKKILENSIQKLIRYLEKNDIEIVDYTNQKYNDGLNIEILAIEKEPSITESIVKETIEPTIICKGQVIRKAKIILISK